MSKQENCSTIQQAAATSANGWEQLGGNSTPQNLCHPLLSLVRWQGGLREDCDQSGPCWEQEEKNLNGSHAGPPNFGGILHGAIKFILGPFPKGEGCNRAGEAGDNWNRGRRGKTCSSCLLVLGKEVLVRVLLLLFSR